MKVYKVLVDHISLSYRQEKDSESFFNTISLSKGDIFFISDIFYEFPNPEMLSTLCIEHNVLTKIIYKKNCINSEIKLYKVWEEIDNINLIRPFVSYGYTKYYTFHNNFF